MKSEDNVKLHDFIEAAKAKGAADEFLAAFLTRRGWPADDVYSALGEYWERATGLSIPARSGAGESSRDAFFYLLAFATLATWATALGSMLFQFVDRWFPDAVSQNAVNVRLDVTWQMASIVVAFPIYLLVMRIIVREAQEQPERLQSGVRKWLTYIALLGTAGAMIGDLIWFLDYFLMGELTARFVLKALTVAAICGAIFTYYLGSLRSRTSSGANRIASAKAYGIGAAIAVVAAFCVGLGVAGTPSAQRHLQADIRRAEELRSIAFAVKAWSDRARLANTTPEMPATLEQLRSQRSPGLHIVDPETGVEYEYGVTLGSTYRLCGIFSSSQPETPAYGAGLSFWSHGAGRSCFVLDASRPVVY